MISMLIYDKLEKELHCLYNEVKNQAAYLSDEHWDIITVQEIDGIRKCLDKIVLLDIACMDIAGKGEIAYAEELRRKYNGVYMLLIADASVSPMSYMKPSIMASSLLLRPCTEMDIKKVIREFIEAYMGYFEEGGNSSYVIESKEGRIHIPYHKIYFIEAREKKIFIQTDSAEYGFYNTIDKIEGKLPKYFVRCHRSFIVNTRKIENIILSKNIIYLTEGRDVPLSRSYKSVFKELGKNERR